MDDRLNCVKLNATGLSYNTQALHELDTSVVQLRSTCHIFLFVGRIYNAGDADEVTLKVMLQLTDSREGH